MHQKWNQRCCNSSNLVGCHIHQSHFLRFNNGEIAFKACLYPGIHKETFFIKGGVGLSNGMVLFLFGTQISYALITKVYFFSSNLAIRRFDKTQLIDLRSEEHTSELQSRPHLVCRLLLEKKNKKHIN